MSNFSYGIGGASEGDVLVRYSGVHLEDAHRSRRSGHHDGVIRAYANTNLPPGMWTVTSASTSPILRATAAEAEDEEPEARV